MVSISVSANVKQVKKQLNAMQRKQIPFALASALNEIAFTARKAEQNAQRQYIDRPTSFTNKGYQVLKTNKRALKASLIIPDNRGYLKHTIEGGTSTRAKNKHAIPINKALQNKFGGMARNKTKMLLKRKDHFRATMNGIDGLWARKDRVPQLQIVYKDSITTRKTYPVWKAAQRVVAKRFKHVLDDKLKYALRTAR